MKIIENLVKKSLKFCDNGITLCLNNLISKTFISLFSRGVPNEITFQVWDAFFIYGEVILYKTFIWIAFLFCDKSLVNKEIEEISDTINQKMNQIQGTNSLNYFLLLYNSINFRDIKNWKKKLGKNKEIKNLVLSKPSPGTKCDKNLPYCLFNNEEEKISKNAHYIIHKMNQDVKIYKNYFFDEIKGVNEVNSDDKNNLDISQNSLLVQRQKHICQNN
jgi:hypothetical protein